MILVFGSWVRRPSSAKLSGTRCSSVKYSGNSAKIRAATEMSLVSTEIPAGLVKASTIGKNDKVANAGASSVFV